MTVIQQATGFDSTHIDFETAERPIHKGLAKPWRQLKLAASEAGFNLCIASGYRSFDRQRLLWNDKVVGRRAVLDAAGQPLDMDSLDDDSKLLAILRWSALPGASRHHFGVDIDVYDPNLLPPGYQLQLTHTEAAGVLGPLHRWLDKHLAVGASGFFRPYVSEAFGVAPEPWHLSYAPLARGYQQCLSLEVLRAVIEVADLGLKSNILNYLPQIYQHYVQLPWARYPVID